MYSLDKQQIKSILTDEQVFDYLEYLGGEPRMMPKHIESLTICHAGNSHKLYYFYNTKLFKCWTHCNAEGYMDIFQLTQKVLSRLMNKEVTLPESVEYVASFFKIKPSEFLRENIQSEEIAKSFDTFAKYKRINKPKEQHVVQLKTYNKHLLDHFIKARFVIWEKEGITKEATDKFNILYDPKDLGIVIPHYNIDNELIGIRSRTLNLDMADHGKYRPTRIGNQIYNHPLGFNLYGININKNNIVSLKKAIICESEKAVLQGYSILGPAANIIVGCCGSNITLYQLKLLMSLGIDELIIGFDRQWKVMGDEEWTRHWALLEKLNKRYGNYVNITFMEDRSGNILGYKDAPTDKGKEAFFNLYNNRFKI